jgi:hypothetical protein
MTLFSFPLCEAKDEDIGHLFDFCLLLTSYDKKLFLFSHDTNAPKRLKVLWKV